MKTLTPTGRDERSANPASGDVTMILRSASARMDPHAPLIFVSRLAPDYFCSPPHTRCRIDESFLVTEGRPLMTAASNRRARVLSPGEPIDVTLRTLPSFRDARSSATEVRISVKEGAA
jgi:hypothetical protein